MIWQLRESLQCILHLLEKRQKMLSRLAQGKWVNVQWKHKCTRETKTVPLLWNKPYIHQIHRTKDVFHKKKTNQKSAKCSCSFMEYSVLSVRLWSRNHLGHLHFYTGWQGDAASTWVGTYGFNIGEINWYLLEVLHWHLSLAGILEQLNRDTLWYSRHSNTSDQKQQQFKVENLRNSDIMASGKAFL